jgi:SAM-dependent methyltransferase
MDFCCYTQYLMEDRTAFALVELNRKFYEEFGAAFSATRQRIQPGVRRVLENLPDEGCWLDLGCGNGSLARVWIENRRKSTYLGLDFSESLLMAASKDLRPKSDTGADRVAFLQADLTSEEWDKGLAAESFSGTLAFAVLHHLPSVGLRIRLLRKVRGLIAPGGCLYLSVWQFQNSPRMMARRQAWERVGISPRDVDEGDTLLDWRYALPGQVERVGLRYVHLFSRDELETLAADCGFEVQETFGSDGQGGKLSCYQVWRAG